MNMPKHNVRNLQNNFTLYGNNGGWQVSSWIDPLGTRGIYRYIRAEQQRLARLYNESYRLHPKSRRTARYRARYEQLGQVMSVIQSMQRPGKELLPYKALIQSGSAERRLRIEGEIPRDAAINQRLVPVH